TPADAAAPAAPVTSGSCSRPPSPDRSTPPPVRSPPWAGGTWTRSSTWPNAPSPMCVDAWPRRTGRAVLAWKRCGCTWPRCSTRSACLIRWTWTRCWTTLDLGLPPFAEESAMSATCANLDCDQEPTNRLRHQAPDGQHTYHLCDQPTDHAHDWLADRPHLSVTAYSEQLPPRVDQPALF